MRACGHLLSVSPLFCLDRTCLDRAMAASELMNVWTPATSWCLSNSISSLFQELCVKLWARECSRKMTPGKGKESHNLLCWMGGLVSFFE